MRFDEPVLLYGAGREARSTRNFIAQHSPSTKVFVTVDSGEAAIDGAEAIAPLDLPAAIAARRFGTIVKSPGVSRYRPIFAQAREAGITVTSNLNLWAAAYRDKCAVIAISGTKGKSTTATLVHLMLVESALDAGLAGNVGLAPLEIAGKHKIVVFELSSYQTADMAFSPDIAAMSGENAMSAVWYELSSKTTILCLSAISSGASPTLPASPASIPDSTSMRCSSVAVVDLPLVPEIAMTVHFSRYAAAQRLRFEVTVIPASRACAKIGR